MTLGADCERTLSGHFVVATVIVALLAACGCSSSAQSRSVGPVSSNQTVVATAPVSPGPHIDTSCVADHIESPPEMFHYSFKAQDGTTLRDEEAEISLDTIDGVLTDNGSSLSFHATHSNNNWDSAMINLSGAVRMLTASASMISDSSAMVSEGVQTVNGYNTTKYSIDTTRGNAQEMSAYQLLLGRGGFAKGTASLTIEGCPVELVLDEEVHGAGGGTSGVDKVHYELAMVRK